MIRAHSIVTLLLLAMFGLNGCGQEEPAKPKETTPTTETDTDKKPVAPEEKKDDWVLINPTKLPATVLKEGGYVVWLRHTEYDDELWPTPKIQEWDYNGWCGVGNDLNAIGVADAKAINKKIKKLKVEVTELYSSTSCRTSNTAKLVFERDPIETRNLLAFHDFMTEQEFQAKKDFVRDLLTRPVPQGKVRVVSAHSGTGYRYYRNFKVIIERGEAAIFKPINNNTDFELIGVVSLEEFKK